MNVHFTNHDGSMVTAVGKNGDTVMEIARNNGLFGIVAECGGAAMCATCHVYVASEWLEKIPPISDFEDELLEGTGAPRTQNSRLSCQIKLDDNLNGLHVSIPETQY